MPIDPITKEASPDESTVDILLRTKFLDWKYENEYRLFVQLDHSTQESGGYFYEFSESLRLSEVVLGARCDLPIKRINELLIGFPQPVKLIKARLAPQTFSVIAS